MDIVKINDLLIDVSSENTKLHLENEKLKEEIIALRKGLSKTRIRRDKYKRKYIKEKCKNKQISTNWNELKKWLEEEIYNIEPKGTRINYNCEYDSEEDYINAMKERSKLITLKRTLIQMQEIESGKNE